LKRQKRVVDCCDRNGEEELGVQKERKCAYDPAAKEGRTPTMRFVGKICGRGLLLRKERWPAGRHA